MDEFKLEIHSDLELVWKKDTDSCCLSEEVYSDDVLKHPMIML